MVHLQQVNRCHFVAPLRDGQAGKHSATGGAVHFSCLLQKHFQLLLYSLLRLMVPKLLVSPSFRPRFGLWSESGSCWSAGSSTSGDPSAEGLLTVGSADGVFVESGWSIVRVDPMSWTFHVCVARRCKHSKSWRNTTETWLTSFIRSPHWENAWNDEGSRTNWACSNKGIPHKKPRAAKRGSTRALWSINHFFIDRYKTARCSCNISWSADLQLPEGFQSSSSSFCNVCSWQEEDQRRLQKK